MTKFLTFIAFTCVGMQANARLSECSIESMKPAVEKYVRSQLENLNWKGNEQNWPVEGSLQFHPHPYLRGDCRGLCKGAFAYRDVKMDTMYADVFSKYSPTPLRNLRIIQSTLLYKGVSGHLVSIADSSAEYMHQFRVFEPVVNILADSAGILNKKVCVTAIPTGSLKDIDGVLRHQKDYTIQSKSRLTRLLFHKWEGIFEGAPPGTGYEAYELQKIDRTSERLGQTVSFPDLIVEEME